MRSLLAGKLQLRPEDRIIVFAGRLMWTKGVQYAVSCLPRVVAHFPSVRLLIAGEGPSQGAPDGAGKTSRRGGRRRPRMRLPMGRMSSMLRRPSGSWFPPQRLMSALCRYIFSAISPQASSVGSLPQRMSRSRRLCSRRRSGSSPSRRSPLVRCPSRATTPASPL